MSLNGSLNMSLKKLNTVLAAALLRLAVQHTRPRSPASMRRRSFPAT